MNPDLGAELLQRVPGTFRGSLDSTTMTPVISAAGN